MTWKTSHDRLFLLIDGLPLVCFYFKVLAFIRGLKWVWSWEDADNILDHRLLLPDDLAAKFTLFPRDITPDGLDAEDPRIVAALWETQSQWYTFLVDDHQIIVVGLGDVYKWYV